MQVDQALAAWRTAITDVRSARKLVETCREATHTAVGLYRSSMATALDVVTAQASLTVARGSGVQALTAYAIARAAMVRVTRLASIASKESSP